MMAFCCQFIQLVSSIIIPIHNYLSLNLSINPRYANDGVLLSIHSTRSLCHYSQTLKSIILLVNQLSTRWRWCFVVNSFNLFHLSLFPSTTVFHSQEKHWNRKAKFWQKNFERVMGYSQNTTGYSQNTTRQENFISQVHTSCAPTERFQAALQHGVFQFLSANVKGTFQTTFIQTALWAPK